VNMPSHSPSFNPLSPLLLLLQKDYSIPVWVTPLPFAAQIKMSPPLLLLLLFLFPSQAKTEELTLLCGCPWQCASSQAAVLLDGPVILD
jgi:hypothetical protein